MESANKISYMSMYILSMWSKSGIQMQLKRILSPDFPAALHCSNDVTHSGSRNTHAFFRCTRWRNSRDRDQNVPIRMNPCDFRKKRNGNRWNLYMLSERRHGWTRSCLFNSVKWEMRAQERETNQVPSALGQKFSLKINIVAYGDIFQLLVALGLLNPKM